MAGWAAGLESCLGHAQIGGGATAWLGLVGDALPDVISCIRLFLDLDIQRTAFADIWQRTHHGLGCFQNLQPARFPFCRSGRWLAPPVGKADFQRLEGVQSCKVGDWAVCGSGSVGKEAGGSDEGERAEHRGKYEGRSPFLLGTGGVGRDSLCAKIEASSELVWGGSMRGGGCLHSQSCCHKSGA